MDQSSIEGETNVPTFFQIYTITFDIVLIFMSIYCLIIQAKRKICFSAISLNFTILAIETIFMQIYGSEVQDILVLISTFYFIIIIVILFVVNEIRENNENFIENMMVYETV